jgi:integrase
VRGHVRKRGRTYSIVLDVGTDPATGKRRQQWRSGFRTKKEAEAELARLIHNVERGSDPFPSNLTVSEFVDRWLEHERARLRPTTHHRYTQLDRLRPAHIQKAMDSMSDRGQSPASVVQARAALGSAMTTAVAWGLLAVNPVRSVKPPRIARAQLVVPTVEQLRTLIEVARGSVWEVPVLLAATTGMRRSEVLALRWCDVDFKVGRVRVTRSLQRMVDGSIRIFDPNTPRARREIAMPVFTLPLLKSRRRAQQEAQRLAGMRSDEFDLVCDRGDGQPIDPSTFTHAFKRLVHCDVDAVLPISTESAEGAPVKRQITVDFNRVVRDDMIRASARRGVPGTALEVGSTVIVGDDDWGVAPAEIVEYDEATGALVLRVLGELQSETATPATRSA